MQTFPLARGAEARARNPDAPLAAVLVNGGTARRVPGTWSATSEWLAERLAKRFPEIAFVEVRYRTKSWNELGSCMEDAADALDAAGRPSILVGFSMGGAVAIGVADHERVEAVLGLAPWIPTQLDLRPLAGKALRRRARRLGPLAAVGSGGQREAFPQRIRASSRRRCGRRLHPHSAGSPRGRPALGRRLARHAAPGQSLARSRLGCHRALSSEYDEPESSMTTNDLR